ncbi:MAG: serine/threonine protein kinase [Proteobacteria bacterium]|nr:serine/threonine protein kinase [Pseudomonadota bacterium]
MNLPASFGKYVLLERINVGGMAEVFRARTTDDAGFERLVAVKKILEDLGRDRHFIDMFIDEAKIAVQLNHANIAQIFDLGQVDGAYFIAMEYVQGKDLRAIFERCRAQADPMPIRQACFVVMKVCEGLDYAHSKRDATGRPLNLVHRDVSPPNLILSYEGEVKLIDFGIVKAASNVSKTQAGALKGKVGYMSPEQVRGLPVDARSDVFSVGIILYELLTGQTLFEGVDDFALLEQVRRAEVPRPSTVNRKISDELEQIVLQALARDPDDRYQHAVELHDDLQAYLYASGAFYSRKDLAAWMKRVFAREMEDEQRKLKGYEELELAPARAALPAPRPHVRATGPARPGPPTAPLRATGRDGPGDLDRAAGSPAEAAPVEVGAITHAATSVDALPAAPSPPPPLVEPAAVIAAEEKAADAAGVAPAAEPPTAQIAWVPAWRRALPLLVASGAVGVAVIAALLYVLLVRDRRAGSLQLTTTPADVEVFVDGQPHRGRRQPLRIDGLSRGTHGLSVRRAEYVNWSGEVEVRPGEVTQVSVQLSVAASGGVELRTEPVGAEVQLDGVRLEGRTPMRVRRLEPGVHRIVVSKPPEFSAVTREVRVVAGAVEQVSLVLANKRVRLRVVSDPPGAAYLLEGDGSKSLGRTPAETVLQLGRAYSVSVRRAGYALWSAPVVFSGAREVTVEARLKLLTGTPQPARGRASRGGPGGAKPGAEPRVKPTPKPTPKPAASAKPTPKPAPKPAASAKPTPKPAPKPAASAKPTPKPAPKPAASAKPTPKPAPKPAASAKPTPKPVANPKVEAKPKAGAGSKAAARADAKQGRVVPRVAVVRSSASVPAQKARATGNAQATGHLLVNSVPWTKIVVDGRDTGLTTPQRALELAVGTHKIKLRSDQLSLEQTFTVVIRAGEVTRLVKTLR